MGDRPKSDHGRSDSGSEIVIHQAHPKHSLSEALIRQAVERTLEGEGFRIDELSIVVADHSTVRELNRTWLGHDYETDVVAFLLDEEAQPGKRINGEVYVDLDTAIERAPEFGASMEEEALRYVLHGLLHLMGHSDTTDEQRAAMRALENRYLDASG